MEVIFHEKQEGSLCAQHCLNALLQGSYFTAVDLAEIARGLDESERQHMAVGGVMRDEYQRFIEQPSSNFDDSGYFSIQVLQSALRVWNLDLLPYTSSDAIAQSARADPLTQQVYICNFKDHWFTVRKLGFQWFNLNSLLTHPELISDTYLQLFLTQLQQEGYSIFIVLGELPACEADQLLRVTPAVQPVKPRLLAEVAKERKAGDGQSTSGASASTSQGAIDDDDLERALAESRRLVEQDDTTLQSTLAMTMAGREDMEDEYVKRAIAASMKDIQNWVPDTVPAAASTGTQPGDVSERLAFPSTSTVPQPDHSPSSEEVRNRRMAFLDRLERKEPEGAESPEQNTGITGTTEDINEEAMLAAALQMSVQQDT